MIMLDKDKVIAIYKDMIANQYKFWSMITDHTLQREDIIEEAFENQVYTEVEGDCIKITIKDILPREVNITNSMIRTYWLSLMSYALKDVQLKYDKVICAIKVISPATYWDVDNRAYKIIVDAIRLQGLIKDDQHRYLSLLILGDEIDKENPRTEITIFPQPDDPIKILRTRNRI